MRQGELLHPRSSNQRDHISRRDLLTSAAFAGVSSLALGGECALASPLPARDQYRRLSTDDRKQAQESLLTYFAGIAPQLLRPPEGILRYPSISPSLPGKGYSTTLWDWDTRWNARGLFQLANMTGDRELHGRVCEHAQGSLLNFLDHQSGEGRIPISLDVKAPDFFGSLRKAAPNSQNQAKPVMAQLALLVADEVKEVEWLAPRFDQLLRFHDSWVLGNMASIGLLVWGDDVAIGDDNDPTTFGRPYFSSANLLLNCLYYQDLRAAAELARRLNRQHDQAKLSARADELGARIQTCCWDPRDRFYYTVDVQCVDRRTELIPNVEPGMPMSWSCLPLRIQMFTGFLPLWCRLATPEQARALIETNYLSNENFRSPWGVRSLSSQESMYSLVRSGNPSNWLGPIWIIVNYFVWSALQAYGFHAEAADLADKTLHMLALDLSTSGSLNEYYDPDTGRPLSVEGFVSWNMLVLGMI